MDNSLRTSASGMIAQQRMIDVIANNLANVNTTGFKRSRARFLNPNGLLSIGNNQYSATEASGDPITGAPQEEGFGGLMQGALESSNVEIVQEMTDMIAAQRAYEINAKAIRAGEDMMQMTNDLIR